MPEMSLNVSLHGFSNGAFFVDHFCYLCFVSVMLSCLSIAALWSPAEKGLASWLSYM